MHLCICLLLNVYLMVYVVERSLTDMDCQLPNCTSRCNFSISRLYCVLKTSPRTFWSVYYLFLSVVDWRSGEIDCFAKFHHLKVYGWFRQLLTSVCSSPSSIWLPLRECLLSPKRTLREFFQIFLRLPQLLYTPIELLSVQKRLFLIIFC